MVTIGGVRLAFDGEGQKSDFDGQTAYHQFFDSGRPDIRICLHKGAPPVSGGRRVFDCPPIWAFFRHEDTRVFSVFPHESYPGAERVLVFSNGPDKVDLFFPGPPWRRMDPLTGPTLELLMVTYLGQKRGVITHSCGITLNGKGVLFVGESGAGKSTLARLWGKEKDVEILSDDRTIIRERGGNFWIYGTPWHGDAGFASPQGARLESIFFLRHGRTCSIRRVRGVDSVSRLLTCTFPSYWDPDGMSLTLDMLSDLVSAVPCHDLTFTPDRRVLYLVRETMTSHVGS